MRTLTLATLAAALALSPLVRADAPAETQTQVATGEAAILGGDKPAAREKALQDALRNAVQMAVGTQVTSTTEVEGFRTRLDQVLTRSAGYVRKYTLLDEHQDNDVVQVKISAEVSLGALDKDLEAMGLLLQRKGMPRTMVLIAEQDIGMAAPRGAWMGEGKGEPISVDLRLAENVVLDELRKSGFAQLIDPEIAESKTATVGGVATTLSAAQARKIGQLTHAEVIVIGQVVAVSRGPMGELGPEWKSCAATLTARAVNTDTGDILATAEASQPAAALDELSCGKDAIKKASKLFTGEMVKKIAERWSGDVSGGGAVHLTLRGVDSLATVAEIERGLSDSIRGVKSVQSRGYNDGVAELDVTLVGSTEQFAQELEAKRPGKHALRVKGMTANTVTAELAR